MKTVFHRHSTFIGLIASAIVSVALGAITHWSWVAMIFAAFVGICVFPRFFYGTAESRALDNATPTPGSLWSDPEHRGARDLDMADIGTDAFRLERAYNDSTSGAKAAWDASGNPADPDALRKVAEGETRNKGRSGNATDHR